MRPLTEGPFGQWVGGLFLKYSGTRVVPKNLRSIFISLDLVGANSRWKTPRAAAAPPAPTPMTNEWSDGGFTSGDTVEAMGRSPGGSREWFKATVIKIRLPPAWPPIVVKFIATLEGGSIRLALPDPVTAYCHADDVRRIAD